MSNDPTVDNNLLDDYKVETVQQPNGSHRQVIQTIADVVIPKKYDEIDLTYVASGNGEGELETVTYKLEATTLGTLTLTYDADNKLSNILYVEA